MKKILIVDDNPQNLYMLEILLETNGFVVIQASNGKEALDLAHQTLPNLIISDILMPVMDGFSLCRAWKNDEVLKKVPFIFYTATYTDPKDEAFARSLGAERFIVKPMVPEEFLLVLLDVLQANDTWKEVQQMETPIQEDVYYKEYNEALIRKLEDKMMQLEQANKRLAALYQASCDLATAKISGDLIQSVLRAIVDTAGYQQVNFFQFDQEQNRLFLLSGVGFPEQTLTKLKASLAYTLGDVQGLVGLAAQSGRLFNVADASVHPYWDAIDPSVRSALFVPVNYEELLMGVLAIYSPEMDAFSDDDERNIAALANSLAISIENEKTRDEILQLNAKLEKRVAERTAQLVNSNRELEAFAYSVSHDLRAPLRAIDGFTRILSEDYANKLDEQGNHLLSKICAHAAKMDKLITDLLSLSRVSLSELQLTRIDMTALVKSVIHETVSSEEKQKVIIRVDPLVEVYGDPTLIRQVWSNLISNAIKYTLPRAERTIQIKSHVEKNLCEYIIQDNGVGFNPDYTHKLFGVFQRLHNPDEFEGTGIGLAIVKRIIERHGGRVSAESTLGQGATFSFYLPLSLPAKVE